MYVNDKTARQDRVTKISELGGDNVTVLVMN
jgi:hypothetical protein